ncbi:uncharacterized protein LOC141643562 [Silene latifolia]|uniref:uncharacterized protein LOC141643562 n=1 Tax=Silene latifolia TaxID=37657 RepID=UPI003D778CD7
MGNCQTAEVATVEVQHPEKRKSEWILWSISANEVMSSNPGYYVALVVPRPRGGKNGKSDKDNNNLKLLRPGDTLHIGQVYRLISFEDVIKDFTLKKTTKSGKFLKGSGVLDDDNNEKKQIGSGSRGVGRKRGGGGQWRPALQTIAEI